MASVKALLVRNLCRPGVGRFLSALFGGRVPSVRFPGLRVDTRNPAVTPETVARIFWGIYESAELRFVRRYLRPDLDVVEVGSSLGAVSSQIARIQQPGRRLFCVEANPDLVPTLKGNVGAASSSAVVVHRAIGDGGSRVTFSRGGDNVSGRAVSGGDPAAGEEIPASPLSELLREFEIDDYALVSDIEGAEAGFIAGDPGALEGCQQLLIELHDGEASQGGLAVDDLVSLLVDRHGFTLRDRRGPVCVFERATRDGTSRPG